MPIRESRVFRLVTDYKTFIKQGRRLLLVSQMFNPIDEVLRISLTQFCQSVPIIYIVGGFYIPRTWRMSPCVHVYRRCSGFVALGNAFSCDGTFQWINASWFLTYIIMYIHDIHGLPL